LAVPGGRDWLDVGCGTGTLVRAILATESPRTIKGIDRSEGFIASARVAIQDDRVSFEAGDAQALPAESAAYDAVVSGLVLNFVPSPERAASEMFRVTRPGGLVGVYVWDYAGKMQLMRHFWDAAIALDANAATFHEGSRFPLCQPEPLEALFKATGFDGVLVRDVEVDTVFKDFDDYWSPFLGGQGPAPTYAMSLSNEARLALRERIRAGLPIAPDGSIPLTARAWAVRGVRPG
ncbi:MAG TPA: class I SAM-dependent methyltransferase, partial [Anaerolineales bacterium]|nr:class I SAM-dependent methyltransferase [Anaerolineales bacterium]